MDESPQPIYVSDNRLYVSFYRLDAPSGAPGWLHHMHMVPRVGDAVRFRCTSATCEEDHDTEEAQLLMSMAWVVARVEIQLGCEEDDECECECHEEDTEHAPCVVSTIRYAVYVTPEATT